MNFFLPPPRRPIMHPSPVSVVFMKSMEDWAKREYDYALSLYTSRRDKKGWIYVKYQISPFMILAKNPLFAEVFEAPMDKLIPVWEKLDLETRRIFAAAAKYYKERRRH